MMKRLLYVLALLALTVPLSAQYRAQVNLAPGATASGFTAADINAGGGHNQANSAVCRLDAASGSIRFRVDGTAATNAAAGGTEANAGDVFYVNDNIALNAFSAIRTGATSGAIACNLSQ